MVKIEELTNPKSCMSRAGDHEMTFVLLARDASAPATIRFWVTERIRLGKNDAHDDQILEALHCANFMEQQRTDRLGIEAKKLPEIVSTSEKLVRCKGQPEPHIRIHACREPIVEVP